MPSRRDFLKTAALAVAGATVGVPLAGAKPPRQEFLGIPDPAAEVWTDWTRPPTAHDEAELVVPEVLCSFHGPDRPIGPLDVADYRGWWSLDQCGRAVNWIPATGPQAVWQSMPWDALGPGDIVRWRNPDGTYSGQISVVLERATRLPPSEGYWSVKVDELRNGYRVKGFVCRFRWQRDGEGEVWLAPEGTPDEHYSKGGSLIALYRVEGERAVMHWTLEDWMMSVLGVRE